MRQISISRAVFNESEVTGRRSKRLFELLLEMSALAEAPDEQNVLIVSAINNMSLAHQKLSTSAAKPESCSLIAVLICNTQGSKKDTTVSL